MSMGSATVECSALARLDGDRGGADFMGGERREVGGVTAEDLVARERQLSQRYVDDIPLNPLVARSSPAAGQRPNVDACRRVVRRGRVGRRSSCSRGGVRSDDVDGGVDRVRGRQGAAEGVGDVMPSGVDGDGLLESFAWRGGGVEVEPVQCAGQFQQRVVGFDGSGSAQAAVSLRCSQPFSAAGK